MARSIMEIEDPDLRNAVWGLGEAVGQKAAKKKWQPPARQRGPDEDYRGHSEEQVAAAARLAKRITAESD